MPSCNLYLFTLPKRRCQKGGPASTPAPTRVKISEILDHSPSSVRPGAHAREDSVTSSNTRRPFGKPARSPPRTPSRLASPCITGGHRGLPAASRRSLPHLPPRSPDRSAAYIERGAVSRWCYRRKEKSPRRGFPLRTGRLRSEYGKLGATCFGPAAPAPLGRRPKSKPKASSDGQLL